MLRFAFSVVKEKCATEESKQISLSISWLKEEIVCMHSTFSLDSSPFAHAWLTCHTRYMCILTSSQRNLDWGRGASFHPQERAYYLVFPHGCR